MVHEHLPTCARTKSPSFAGKYTIRESYGISKVCWHTSCNDGFRTPCDDQDAVEQLMFWAWTMAVSYTGLSPLRNGWPKGFKQVTRWVAWIGPKWVVAVFLMFFLQTTFYYATYYIAESLHCCCDMFFQGRMQDPITTNRVSYCKSNMFKCIPLFRDMFPVHQYVYSKKTHFNHLSNLTRGIYVRRHS